MDPVSERQKGENGQVSWTSTTPWNSYQSAGMWNRTLTSISKTHNTPAVTPFYSGSGSSSGRGSSSSHPGRILLGLAILGLIVYWLASIDGQPTAVPSDPPATSAAAHPIEPVSPVVTGNFVPQFSRTIHGYGYSPLFRIIPGSVIYPAKHKGHGGCEGQLMLTSAGMYFACPTDATRNFSVGRNQIEGSDHNGVRLFARDRYGRDKYHFEMGQHASQDDVHALFDQWLSGRAE